MTSTTTANAPTYTAAAKLAETLPADQVRDLVLADGNPIVYMPKCPRRVAMDVRPGATPRYVAYEYGDRRGYTRTGFTDFVQFGGFKATVFHLRDGRYIAAEVTR